MGELTAGGEKLDGKNESQSFDLRSRIEGAATY